MQKYAAEENLAINITIFEKTDRIGGRSLTVNAYDDPSQPIELGASIFVKVNHILPQAASDFNLPLGSLSSENPGDITAIWDGERIVFQTVAGQSFWRDAAKMIWRYGPSPYYATKLVKDTVGKFLKLYEEPWFPFESLTQRAFELGLTEITSMTGAQFLAENKVCEIRLQLHLKGMANEWRSRLTRSFVMIFCKRRQGLIMHPIWPISMDWRPWFHLRPMGR